MALEAMSILDALPDPVFVVDRRGRIAYLNRACETAFGAPASRVVDRPLDAALGDALDDGLRALLSPTPRAATPVSLRAVRLGAGLWDVRVTPGSDGTAAVHCVPSTGQPAGWLDLVVDSVDAIWATDDDERIIAWNRGAEELFGYTAEEITGQPVARLIPADLLTEREPERLRKALRELGAVRDYPTRRLTKDGREIEVSLTRTVTRNGPREGEGLPSLTIVRDLSQRRQIERQVIESEKLGTLGQLAASVAQEIGAPLTSIGIVIESLRKSGWADEEGERQLEMAAQQLSRIARLAHGLVELAKPGELHLSRVRIGSVIERVVELMTPSLERARVRVEVEPLGALPEVQADAGQLQQVFLNLLMNAQRALQSRGGGRVSIRAELTRGLPVVGRPVREALSLEVSDEGPGIDPTDLHYIFTPFFSRSGGSGLGLALAKQIIHAHGGTIDARSTPGHGATFTITLPVESDA